MKFSLSYPVTPVYFIQKFGENPQMYADPKYGGVVGHNGIDFNTGHGQPVYASHDGLASYQVDGGGGHGVVIVTDTEFDYLSGKAYFKSIYWHLADGLKEPKFASPIAHITGFIPVKAGQIIGYADNTGASTGDHLHFGLKPVRHEGAGVYSNIESNNGYLGAIDPMPYFQNVQILQDQLTATQIKLIDVLKIFANYLRSKIPQKNQATP